MHGSTCNRIVNLRNIHPLTESNTEGGMIERKSDTDVFRRRYCDFLASVVDSSCPYSPLFDIKH